MGMSSLSASVFVIGDRSPTLRKTTARAPNRLMRHPLDGGDVDEGVAELRRRSGIQFGSTLGSNGSSSPKSSLLEPLAVDLVFLRRTCCPCGVSKEANARTACAASALRSTRNRMRRASFDFEQSIDLRDGQ